MNNDLHDKDSLKIRSKIQNKWKGNRLNQENPVNPCNHSSGFGWLFGGFFGIMK
jgi:hypothetical protein